MISGIQGSILTGRGLKNIWKFATSRGKFGEGFLLQIGEVDGSGQFYRTYVKINRAVLHTTSRRLADRKVEKFEKNITKRGAVPETTTKKGSSYPVGPILIGFFVFVVIGSSLFQIIRTATSGGMA
ncbi:hypothetical protein ACH5RR_030850 [Cinchona calisaya]|uniref:Stress-associated endoplasmic reticulum protein n=1 Tax=Cinchona calisaya TaxID=153742 RepID=A0ABD2YYM8_9GENT